MKRTFDVNASRLRNELAFMGMETDGSRSELINKLHQAGVYYINTEMVNPPALHNSYDPSCVCIGTKRYTDKKNTFSISNNANTIISGDFANKSVTIHDCLRLVETADLSSETPGIEGEFRLKRGVLYMFRTTDVEMGWYSLSFGRMMIF
jgi:hypothetical protein